MATAKKLPSGNWRAKAFVGRDENGKLIFESFTAPTKKEAEYLAAEFTAGKKAKEKVSLTLGEAMDEFLDTCRAQDYSPSTIKEYAARRKTSYPSIIDKKLDRLTTRDVQLAMDERKKTKTAKTVRNDFYLLKRVLTKYAPDLNLATVILSRNKTRRKLEFRESMAFDVLCRAKEAYEPEFYLYCCFILSAGLRPSEIYALTWGDLSAEPMTAIGKDKQTYQFGEIQVHAASVKDENKNFVTKSTKTAAGERVLHPDWSFFANLYSLKERGKPGERIMKMNPDIVTKRWEKLRKELNLPENMRFYDLRHFYATAYANSGANEEELQKAMGHSTASFTHKIYVELFRERETAVNAKMAEQTADLYNKINEAK